MALPRKQLLEKLENITPENVQSTLEWILSGHTATVDALKEERDTYKAKADTLDDVAKERDTYKAQAEKAGDAAKVQAEFDAYKSGVEKRELNARKTTALDEAFVSLGVKRDTARRMMLREWELDKVELDESGKIKDMDGIKAVVEKDYADFVSTTDTRGTPPANPPKGGKNEPEDPFEKGFDE